ncbi:MAG: AI-2E family transporter [Sphingopyxis sp.]|nr:AI-2E family transporter [Sphingopyxis sp.]
MDGDRERQDGATGARIASELRWLRYIGGGALLLALPFALSAGAEFFLPLTAALVIAIALVPALDWLERRGVPSALAALSCVIAFLILINGALALIIVPASSWFLELPARLPRIQANLSPLIDFYANLQRFVDEALQAFATNTAAQAEAVAIETPSSLMDYLSTSAPAAAIQTFFALLLIYFFLAGWTATRKRTISSRGSFDSAMTTARVIQNVVDATSAYISTIAVINALLGLAVALLLWAIGMPSPFMWGGIVALCNFVPYIGPIIAALLLAMGGLMTFDSIALAMAPAFIQIGLHMIEANLITPMVLGRRLTINPLLILVSLSFWGWVWGAPGALLAVPLLIIGQTLVTSLAGAGPGQAGTSEENATGPPVES